MRQRDRAVAFAAVGLTVIASAAVFGQIGTAELERLRPYGSFWEYADQQLTALAPERQRAIADATARARTEFAGRGVEIARHFLTHTDHQVPNEAYWFVLGALADTDAATAVIRALPRPPNVVAGVLPRDQGEIRIAIETMLTAPAIGESQAVTDELIRVIEGRTAMSGPPDIAVQLLGRCRTVTARIALARLLTDPSPQIRGLAAKALGDAAAATGGAVTVPVESLAQVLERDGDWRARVEAAAALGRIGGTAGIAALTAALDRERTPQVVDAIASALQQAGTAVTDPERCRSIVERAWEPQAVRACFERWRNAADHAAVIEAAEHGPPVLRILAIEALTDRPVRKQLIERQGFSSPDIDPRLGARLLASLRDLLSRPASDVSPNLPFMAHQALWEASRHDMAVALPYVDEIAPMAARYAASLDLARRDPDAYARARRPRQMMTALVVAVAGLVIAFVPALRAAGFCVMLSAAALALWTSRATSVRTLPPPLLMFLTVPAIGFLVAGVVAGVATWVERKWRVRGLTRFGLAAAAIVVAGLTALVIAGWSRSTRRFPVGGEGAELIIDPLAAGILAGFWASLLLAGVAVVRRVRPDRSAIV